MSDAGDKLAKSIANHRASIEAARATAEAIHAERERNLRVGANETGPVSLNPGFKPTSES